MTSRFICEHITRTKYQTTFYCLDTFSSFTKNDLDFEVLQRGKNRSELMEFNYNNHAAWCRHFSQYRFVKPIQCDVNHFDFISITPIKFAFLDVDLYHPTKAALDHIRPHMAPGGVIMVDDVLDNRRWDGAYEAFMEFVEETGTSYEMIGNKCALIKTERRGLIKGTGRPLPRTRRGTQGARLPHTP